MSNSETDISDSFDVINKEHLTGADDGPEKESHESKGDPSESSLQAEDSGDDTPDTDKEEEEQKKREAESRKKGTKLISRASFKRDRVDRHYDR